MGFTVLPEPHNHIMYPFIFVCVLIFSSQDPLIKLLYQLVL